MLSPIIVDLLKNKQKASYTKTLTCLHLIKQFGPHFICNVMQQIICIAPLLKNQRRTATAITAH